MIDPKWTIIEADTHAGIQLAGEIVDASNTGDPLYYLPCIELIAAKRELYEALEAAVEWLGADTPEENLVWVKARAALSKARGE